MNRSNRALVHAFDKGYRVNKEGTLVTSPFQSNPLALGKLKLKYSKFTIRFENRFSIVPVHRLQAYQKYGSDIFSPGILVRHLNGDPQDNSWDNIAIGSYTDNLMDKKPSDRVEHALKGARTQRKLSWNEMEQLRKDRENGDKYSILCARYNLSKAAVSYIVNNKTYNTA